MASIPAFSRLRGYGISCGTASTASTRCSPVCHTPRYHAGRHPLRHVSRSLPSPVRATTAIYNASFQAKGCEEFSRRGGIQKKPQEMHISLRQNRALKVEKCIAYTVTFSICEYYHLG